LNEELYAAAHAVGLDDPYNGPDRVENLWVRIVLVFVLGHRKEAAIALQRLLDGLDRAGAARGYRYGDTGIDDRVAKRQYG
jgi:hypothetical protein